jgi:hypothetical protein
MATILTYRLFKLTEGRNISIKEGVVYGVIKAERNIFQYVIGLINQLD